MLKYLRQWNLVLILALLLTASCSFGSPELPMAWNVIETYENDCVDISGTYYNQGQRFTGESDTETFYSTHLTDLIKPGFYENVGSVYSEYFVRVEQNKCSSLKFVIITTDKTGAEKNDFEAIIFQSELREGKDFKSTPEGLLIYVDNDELVTSHQGHIIFAEGIEQVHFYLRKGVDESLVAHVINEGAGLIMGIVPFMGSMKEWQRFPPYDARGP